MENSWLTLAKRLQALASTGLGYASDEFDRERYEEIGQIANEMLAMLGDVPISRIEPPVSDYGPGLRHAKGRCPRRGYRQRQDSSRA